MKCFNIFILMFVCVNSVKQLIPNDAVKFTPNNDYFQKMANYFQLLSSFNNPVNINPTFANFNPSNLVILIIYLLKASDAIVI
jgi:hypothetical protein